MQRVLNGETDIEAEEPELIIEGLVPMQDSNRNESGPRS